MVIGIAKRPEPGDQVRHRVTGDIRTVAYVADQRSHTEKYWLVLRDENGEEKAAFQPADWVVVEPKWEVGKTYKHAGTGDTFQVLALHTAFGEDGAVGWQVGDYVDDTAFFNHNQARYWMVISG